MVSRPLWLRGAFVLTASVVLVLAFPKAAVVSDPAHAVRGFETYPNHSQQVRTPENTYAIWMVEETSSHELYSTGLRIETANAVRNQQRFYQKYDRTLGAPVTGEWYSEPAGIVFHTTESPLAPFESEQNAALQRIGKALIAHVRVKRSYNYLIDRFGRVHRIVEEVDSANHAGNSIWAYKGSVFLNLNNSFLAVSFESAGDSPLAAAQINSARLLTQLLRNKYRIPVENCVTHAQVSVNPSNMRIGYHTDGARAFPFVEIGLPNNYDLPVTAIADFGFEYDEAFERALGLERWHGLELAEDLLNRRATDSGTPLDEYRAELRDRYRRVYAAIKEAADEDEPYRGARTPTTAASSALQASPVR